MAGGLFLSWRRPSRDQQKACIAHAGVFNYDPRFRAASSPLPSRNGKKEAEDALSKNGFFIKHARVLLGSGPLTFRLAKSALLSWRHFRLGWAFVDTESPIETGAKFCVCVKELLPWVMMPLQVAYVTDISTPSKQQLLGLSRLVFGFGSGTLQGHLLAGEERFSIEWDENDQVWYETFSFSKPAHILSVIAYPYVQLRQKYFAQQSTNAVLKYVTSKKQFTT
ncbi:LOW QUALITY PROTEIN: UPF0548 protein At2g17695-like [Phoenix dactylifera]|uniref:LOW QUALITY PROTEIN: UPF0548 protein At2g17695-like n=1 Tax=Phoenix dactylifera TaxID=42345 RepID=A0A8B8ZZM8_PHODC|nr:LOW QUALITY PROTEIN: UPF0548 protein At2g17695-like [Phoenix dactylifera]